jgi:protein-L-isoaspartate(D-aspartate) O-methyltransferase
LDQALPIGQQQTISQPFVVARMTELLVAHKKLRKILEIGTGSGYQAAILSHLTDEVYSIERIETLYQKAKQRLANLGFNNIFTKLDDGANGWPEKAPFDGIIVTAATAVVPQALLEQLAEEGRLIIPVGQPGYQELQVITRKANNYVTQVLDPVTFVPLLSGVTKERP